MRKVNEEEPKESTKMFALTMILMKFLLFAIAVVVLWLVQMILKQGIELNLIKGGFNI